MKPKGKELVTALARETGKQLNAWTAVEAHAKRLLDNSKETPISDFFLEVHSTPSGVQAIAKVGDAVFKIER